MAVAEEVESLGDDEAEDEDEEYHDGYEEE